MSMVLFLSNNTPSMLLYMGLEASTVIADKLPHDWNVALPMLVTLLLIATLVKLVQPLKAELPMLVTPVGIATPTSLEQD